MNIYITAAVKELKEKLNAYLSLLSYRYANLCVKAEIGALMPVTVKAEKDYNLEDVAKVAIPKENQFEIYPNVPDYLQRIIEGILDVHPEFKMEIVKEDYGNHESHLLYTMPEVDKDRRNLLNDTAKVFYEECNAEIDKECALYTTELPELSGKLSIEDYDDLDKILRRSREESRDVCRDLYEKKLVEIDEAYQRYLTQKKDASEEMDENYMPGIRMDQLENYYKK